MAVLNNLLKQRNEPEPDKMPVEELAALAEDERQTVEMRTAAVERLPYGDVLNRLAFDRAGSRLQRTARQRIAALIDERSLPLERFRADVTDTFAVVSVVGLSNQPDLLECVLDSLDEQALCRLAVEGEPVSLRQLAAERVQNADTLHRLLKDVKGKDKTVFRVAKRKVDAIKDRQKQHDEAAARAERLCAAAERHARLPFDSRYAERTDDLDAQWKALEVQVDPAVAERFADAISGCRGKIEEQQRIAREEQRRRDALDGEASERKGVLSQLGELLASLYEASDIDEAFRASARARLDALAGQWRGLQQHAEAGAGEAKSFERVNRAIESLLELLVTHGSLAACIESAADDETQASHRQQTLKALLRPAKQLPEERVPEVVKRARESVREFDETRREQNDVERKRVRALGGLLRKAERAVDQGHMRQAFGIRKSIDTKLKQIEQPPAGMLRRVEDLDASLDKLQDWRDYAVQPKKEDLVGQMEALVGADTGPESLAAQIKVLQEQWRDVSKGGQDDHPELWERFHKAAEEAYKPCRAYFEQRAELRRKNLEKRKALVEQLDAYERQHDWENPDWKKTERVLRTALDDWRKCSPVNRSELRPVQTEFDSAVERIRERLSGEYDKNIGIKQALIQRAEKLAGQEDVRQAADEIKKLQSQWNQAGVTPRREDRKLWKAFRAHCDTVFERLNEASAAFKAELDEQRGKAEGLCREAEALSERTGKQLLDSRAELDRLREAFGAIENLPRASEKKIRDRFRRATDKFDKRVKQERRGAKARRWDNLLAAADAARRYELSLTVDTDTETARSALHNTIEQIDDWPPEGRRIIERRVEAAQPADDQTLQDNETRLRGICIRAEVLADLETPPHDKELRMQYQLERLQQGLGRAAEANVGIESLIGEWAEVGAVRDEAYNELLERLNACRRKIG